ncbi:MAG: DUF4956 domain-containing protein [Clostridia bacterium]|nr:DUF4956 domain-containing protein [Clostridia bacterium]
MSVIFQSVLSAAMSPLAFFGCLITSIILGAAIAVVYMLTSKKHSSGFVVTLAMVPAVVQIIIMMVNGNLGAGVAVAGAFSLVRFRSIPGTAKEIGAIFIALSTGLATGMGYITFSVIYTAIMLAVLFLYNKIGFGKAKEKKQLIITIPESLNYTDAFEDIFSKLTDEHELISVKTTNMGSLFKLTFEITLKKPQLEKKLIDALRTRNGNLEISCMKAFENSEIL